MRIDRLDLIAFGPFTDQKLDLCGETPGGLFVVYGENEAGKSSSLAALEVLLFGFPHHAQYDFLHPRQSLRVGGVLRRSDGGVLQLVRRRGKKRTLEDPASGEPLEESVLTPYLGHIDRSLFRSLYGINHERLVGESRTLLAPDGDLGQAILGAAAGTRAVQALIADLEERASALYRPRGHKQPLGNALGAERAARRVLKRGWQSLRSLEEQRSALAAADADLQGIEARLAEARQAAHRLRRLQDVLPLLEQRRRARDERVALGEVVPLPPDFKDACRKALEQAAQSERLLRRDTESLERLRRERSDVLVNAAILERDPDIRALERSLGTVERALRDLDKRQSEHEEARALAAERLRQVRPDLPLAECETLRPLRDRRRELTRLAEQRAALEERQQRALERLARLERKGTALEAKLAATVPAPPDLRPLRAALGAARGAGDIDARIQREQARLRARQEQLSSELRSLGRFAGSTADLAAAPLPLPATVERFRERFEVLRGKRRDLEGKARLAETQRAQVEAALEAVLADGAVPHPDELAAARAERDAGWRLVRRRYVEGADPTTLSEAVAHWRRGDPRSDSLPDDYEAQVAETDALADRLREAADRVQQRLQLEQQRDLLSRDLQALEADLAELTAAEEALADEWRAEWAPSGVQPASPEEMRQWRDRAHGLVTQVREAETQAAEVAALVSQRAALSAALVGALAPLGIAPAGAAPAEEAALLQPVLRMAEEALEDLERRTAERAQLVQQQQDLAAERDAAAQDRARAEADLAEWTRKWQRALAGTGLPEDASPERVQDGIEALGEVFSHLRRAEDLQHRITRMQADVSAFVQRADVLSRDLGLGPCPGAEEALRRVHNLAESLAQSREARAKAEELDQRLADLAQQIAAAEQDRAEAEATLSALRRQAQVDTNEALEAAADRAARAAALETQVRDLEGEILRLGDGQGIADLEAAAQAVDPDALAADLAAAEERIAHLSEERDAQRDRVSAQRRDLEAKERSAEAAVARQDVQAATARVAALAEQYLVYRIAQHLLERQVAAYREAHEAPVLGRASEIFDRLTLGAFAGLSVDYDERDQPLLVGLRRRPRGAREPVLVGHLSDGTRDQLYLALRLASLELQLRQGRGEPMPFVADDILVGFDDRRTRAGIGALAELAAHTQVLLFTHHEAVVAHAEAVRDGEKLPIAIRVIEPA